MQISKIFDSPFLYDLFQSSISTKKGMAISKQAILEDTEVRDVLDFGCGNGQISQLFPKSNYLGIEPLSKCVSKAQNTFASENRRFMIGDETSLASLDSDSFDLILMIGVLHHMSDDKSRLALEETQRLLRPSGRLVTIDPVYHVNQSWLSKKIVSLDRGSFVRSYDSYSTMILKLFPSAKFKLYDGLLRIPYDHIYCSAKKL